LVCIALSFPYDGWQIVLDRTWHSLVHAGSTLWIALGVHLCKLAWNCFGLLWALISASWLALALDCTGHSFLHSGKSIGRIGQSSLARSLAIAPDRIGHSLGMLVGWRAELVISSQ
jgi:hypothetical protein